MGRLCVSAEIFHEGLLLCQELLEAPMVLLTPVLTLVQLPLQLIHPRTERLYLRLRAV